jgi:hypothetical protein
VVPGKAAQGRVRWCGWHGMQGVRGSNPLTSTPGQRPSPALTLQPQMRGRLASGRWLDRLRGSWEDPTKATMRVRPR